MVMTATSLSARSHPGTRPVKSEFVPEIYSVQSPRLSSIQRPLCLRTITPTFGGEFVEGICGLIGGMNVSPALGAGFMPRFGESGRSAAEGAGGREKANCYSLSLKGNEQRTPSCRRPLLRLFLLNIPHIHLMFATWYQKQLIL